MLGWMEHLFRELGDFKYRPCPLLRQMVRAGRLGRKSGRGFFGYEGQERLKSEKEAAR
jgi:3-hydroxybutyryl-CoA dehydrogenase